MISKRIFDLFLTVPGTLILTPVMLLIAAAIKIDSAGPVFFRQVRVGRRGRSFSIIKFRTMRTDTGSAGPAVTVDGDERITRIGSLLRKLKLDELPQLFNVIRGEMSLVGPRPELQQFMEYYPAAVRERVLSVPPGITDFAAIEFRNESRILSRAEDPEQKYVEEILPAKLALYEKYVAERSLLVDLRLILRTFATIVSG